MAVAYAGTLAIGKAVAAWAAYGTALEPSAVKLYRQALSRGKAIAQLLVAQTLKRAPRRRVFASAARVIVGRFSRIRATSDRTALVRAVRPGHDRAYTRSSIQATTSSSRAKCACGGSPGKRRPVSSAMVFTSISTEAAWSGHGA